MNWNNIEKIEVVYKDQYGNRTGKRYVGAAINTFRQSIIDEYAQSIRKPSVGVNTPSFTGGLNPGMSSGICDGGVCYSEPIDDRFSQTLTDYDQTEDDDIMKSKQNFMPSGGGYSRRHLQYNTNMDAEQLRKQSGMNFQ